jgi:hypothetical protein
MALAARIEADPGALAAVRRDGDALAGRPELSDDGVALRWRIAVVRAVMAAPPDRDAVRELYGELVDRYRAQPARLAELRPLGDEIRRRETEGTLPRSLVARSTRRSRPAGGEEEAAGGTGKRSRGRSGVATGDRDGAVGDADKPPRGKARRSRIARGRGAGGGRAGRAPGHVQRPHRR